MKSASHRSSVGPTALLGFAAVVAIAAVALLIPSRTSLAAGLAALVLVAGIVFTAPALVFAALFASPGAYWRVGPASFNMSVTDVVTLIAIFAALPFVPWRSRPLRRILSGYAIYAGLVLVSLLARPTSHSIPEWFHRGVLFAGAVLVGAAVANRRHVALALKAFLLSCAVVAVAAIVSTVAHGLEPAVPFGMNKNAVGPLLASGVILLVAAPSRLELRRPTIIGLSWLLVGGVLASQSRGAGLSLVAVIAVYAMRHRSARRRAPLFFLVVSLGLVAVSAATLRSDSIDNPQFNGVEERTGTFDVAIQEIWEPHPLVGGGLRWWDAPGAPAGVPHNLFVSELTEAGIIGLVALLGLIANTLLVLFPRRDAIGEAALLLFLFELLFALSGIFWLAGTMTLPMLVVGLAVGEPVRRGSISERDSIKSVP